jgi:hypothetical protein
MSFILNVHVNKLKTPYGKLLVFHRLKSNIPDVASTVVQ